jgi:DNA-binding response OmpR family regulator
MSANPKRILVIEDDASIRQMVSKVLGRSYTVEVAAGGAEGLERLARDQYDAVVLDVMMPDVGSPEVMEYVKLHVARERCIVLMSAASPAALELAGGHLAVHSTLRKPFDIEALVRAVDSCVEGRTSESVSGAGAGES